MENTIRRVTGPSPVMKNIFGPFGPNIPSSFFINYNTKLINILFI